MTTTNDPVALHQALLARLLALRPRLAKRVRLVARLQAPALLGGDSTRRVFVFLPDMHLMSSAGDHRFLYGFRRINKHRWLRRDLLLDALCDALILYWNKDLPAGVALRTVQLGDFVDLWREERVHAEDVTSMVTRILTDEDVARRRLARYTPSDPATLQADLLVGNHDLESAGSIELGRSRRSFVYGMGSVRSLMATHGDLFDVFESTVPSALKNWFLDRFGERVAGSVYGADRTRQQAPGQLTGSQGAAPVTVDQDVATDPFPPWVNVWVTQRGMTDLQLERGHYLLPSAVRWSTRLRAGNQAALRGMGLESALPDLRTIVVGHSHHARICVHRDPLDAGNDLCLLDCGAWLEEMHFGATKNDDRVASCTIGVLTGGDARIYQIDPAKNLFADSRDGGG